MARAGAAEICFRTSEVPLSFQEVAGIADIYLNIFSTLKIERDCDEKIGSVPYPGILYRQFCGTGLE